MQTRFFDDKVFFSTMLRLAIPIAMQQFVMNALNAVDVLMIGQLGETSVAAVGLANQFFFLLTLFLFGIGSGSAVFSAQFWGRGDVGNLRRVLGLAMVVALSGAGLFTAAALFAPQMIMRFYTADPAVIGLASRYLRLVGWGYVPTAISVMVGITLRSTRNVKLPMAVSIGALSLKTVLAYGLIFGRFGLPALGVTGAATATVIARFLECAALLFLSYRLQLPTAARPRELVAWDRVFLARFARTASPVVVAEILWSLGITTYSAVYARIGTDAIAAVNIASTIESIALVPFMGLGNACAIILGNHIGAGETETANDYAKRFLKLAILVALGVGALVFGVSRVILQLYRVSPEAQVYGRNILAVVAAVMWLKAANMIIIVGILRSGGDTRFGLFLDTGPLWLIGVPLALLGAFVFHLPVYWVVLLVMCDELTKFFIGLRRVSSGRWINNVVRAL